VVWNRGDVLQDDLVKQQHSINNIKCIPNVRSQFLILITECLDQAAILTYMLTQC
jgi:hypothetical protein